MPASGIGGPCDHCGIRASCCWRRGPSSKPILCNACGSRYLVKKSLDGYIPINQRVGAAPRSSPKASKQRNRGNMSNQGVHKPKRATLKRLDASTWHTESYDSEDSEVIYLTDSSAGLSSGAVGELEHATLGRSLLGEGTRSGKVIRIATEEQLAELVPRDMVAQLLGPSMRLKPRKPLRPTISVVF